MPLSEEKSVFFLRRVICSSVPICAPICWCWIAPQRPNVGKQDSLISTQGILGKHTGDNLDCQSLKGVSTKFSKCKTFKSKQCYRIRENMYDWPTRGSDRCFCLLDNLRNPQRIQTCLSHGSFSNFETPQWSLSTSLESITDNKYVILYSTNIYKKEMYVFYYYFILF